LNDIFQGQFQSESDCDFIWALAEIYRDIGYYERALPLLNSLVTLYNNLYGEDCVQLGSVWNSQGMIQYELSHFDLALDAYQKSHAVLEAHLDPYDISSLGKVELAKLDLNIGKIYLKIDYTKSKLYFNSAYQTFLQEKGADDHLTLNALGHKAMFMAHIGKLQEAEKIFLDIYNQIPSDTNNRDLLFLRAGAAHHLGNIYSDYAPNQAMSLLIEARDIFRELLSPTHPDTLDVLNSIGSLRLSTEDDYPEILSEFQQLLDLFIKAYGPDDPNTGTIYNNIGLCYYYMNEPAEAIQNYREAIRINVSAYGENHESTAYIYNNIGAVYSETDHPEKAIPEHERALEIYEAAYPDHLNLDLALTHADLADAYLREGDGDKVMEHLNEAFRIYDQMLPTNARQLIYPYATLSNLLVALEDYENAVINYSHAIKLMLENGYTEDSDTVQEFAARVAEVKQMADNKTVS
jgi:tetratricopeptide (TPR) repeat protein